MKASYQWLKEWVEFDASPQALADRFTMGGLEVDAIESLGEGLEGIVIAQIEEARPHPDADRLRVCQVKGDTEDRTIVCGAPNAQAGLKAPLATLGTTMPNGMTIKRAKLRGVASEGMLCSAAELGLGEGEQASAGLWALPDDAPVGTPLIDYLGLDDTIFDIDLTPNRGDCLSIRGLATEVAALAGGTLRQMEIAPVPANSDQAMPSEVTASQDCPAYFTRVISGVDPNATAPIWMQERLRRCGVRPISAIVDITNYVLLELGQPMHAFDKAKLDARIEVRRAREGEGLVLLDGQTIELDESCLVIADNTKALALAGVMGGLESAVGETTTDIVLESAWFAPEAIMGRARRFGLHTESSHRFERGVDPKLQITALERATALLVDIVGGTPGPIHEAVAPEFLPNNAPIEISSVEVNRLLGTELTVAEIQEVLVSLNMTVTAKASDLIEVIAPSARRDIHLAVDLIEEVARIVGYDALPSKSPSGSLTLQAPSETRLAHTKLSLGLTARGFHEVMGWSFIPDDCTQADGQVLEGLKLANPLSGDQALMRPSLLPGLLEIAKKNRARGQLNQRLFETGHVFGVELESKRLAMLMMGASMPEHFQTDQKNVDFFDVKGELMHLIHSHRLLPLDFQSKPHPWLHPGKAAAVVLDGTEIGAVGQIHPSIAERLDLPKHTQLAELELEPLLQTSVPKHEGVSKYPGSRRDLALVLPEAVAAGDVLKAAKDAGGPRLADVVLFDVYQGTGIEKGFKSLGIGLIIRDNSRTLTDQDVDAVTQLVRDRLAQAFNAELRG